MDVALINPFLKAFQEIFVELGLGEVKRGQISIKSELKTQNEVGIIVGFTRKLKGNIIYSMTEDTAKKIASIMMMGMPVEVFDEDSKSAIAELSNMLSGRVVCVLRNMGLDADMTPPTIVHGKEVIISVRKLQTIMVELNTEVGMIEFQVAFEE